MPDAATAVFVDRENELVALESAFAAADAGIPQVLLLEGEAGIGKTTLVARFLDSVPSARVLRAGGDESESHVPFATADQLLRTGGRSTDALRRGQHVGVGLELLELISADADDRPCIVVIDDAHLIDAESLRALLFAARRLAATRALIILAVRGRAEERLPEGWRKAARSVVAIAPLDPPHIAALGSALGVAMTPEAAGRLWEHTRGNPLHARAVLHELPEDDAWQHDLRPLPVPRSYAELIRTRLQRSSADVVGLVEAAAVLGVRMPLRQLFALAQVAEPLEALDAAVEDGFLRTDDRVGALGAEFTHPLTRAAIYEALPTVRRSALNTAAASIVDDPAAVLRHRVEATTVVDPALLADLEEHARAEMRRGAWSSAVSSLMSASRLSPLPADRERLALEAIEAMLYSGDGAAARRLAEHAAFAGGPRRDSVLAYLAIFAGDVETAERMLARAWDRRALADDVWLSATIAQRSAFLATSRLRGHEAIEWAQRALELAPDDEANGLLVAPSLALASSFIGRREEAHAALDRWLDQPSAPARGAGFVLYALKGFLLLGEGDLRAAHTAFKTSASESLAHGLLVVAALSLSGLTRVEYFDGSWDAAVVSAERAIALAVESEDQWVIGQAHWSASYVAAARGDWQAAEEHVRTIHEQHPTFERHIAAEAIAAAGLAAARERPGDVLAALAPLERIKPGDGVSDPAFLPWQHLMAHALVDDGRLAEAERFLDAETELAEARENPLLAARLAHARGKLEFARHRNEAAVAALRDAHARIAELGMPYERALIELSLGQVLRRLGERRAAAETLAAAQQRLGELQARPALQRCENELAACGLAPARRTVRDYTALTPQERAVTRLVLAGMTNREVARELMLSTKTVEFHLSNIYTKVGVHTRSELRARARANELTL